MRDRSKDEQGAVAVFVAAVLVVLLGISAFAVDLGVQRVARRDMQALADVVALDTARLLNGRKAGQVRSGSDGLESLATTVQRSVERNAGSALGDAPSIQATLVQLDESGDLDVDPETGSAETPDGEVPDAVRITAGTDVAFGFARVLGVSDGSVSRAALAGSQATGCFKLGSWLVRESLPGGLSQSVPVDLVLAQLEVALGISGLPAADLTALGYAGLADATVSIQDLLDVGTLGVGSVDQVLAVEVSALTFIDVVADALAADGDTASAAVLTELLTYATTSNLDSTISLGDLVAVGTDSGAALETGLNAFDLVTGGVLLASGDNLVDVPLGVSLPGLSDLTLDTHVVSPPEQVCGAAGTTGSTSQLGLQVQGSMASRSVPLLTLGDLSLAGSGVTLDVDVAKADGTLVDVTCLENTAVAPDGMTIDVDPVAADLLLQVPVSLSGTIGVALPIVGTIGVQVEINNTVIVSTTRTSSAAEAALQLPPNDLVPFSTDSGLGLTGAALSVTGPGLTLTGGTAEARTALGLVLTDTVLTSLLASVVNPVVVQLDGLLANTLPDLIGLRTSGADVFGLPRPDCSTPVLMG